MTRMSQRSDLWTHYFAIGLPNVGGMGSNTSPSSNPTQRAGDEGPLNLIPGTGNMFHGPKGSCEMSQSASRLTCHSSG